MGYVPPPFPFYSADKVVTRRRRKGLLGWLGFKTNLVRWDTKIEVYEPSECDAINSMADKWRQVQTEGWNQ